MFEYSEKTSRGVAEDYDGSNPFETQNSLPWPLMLCWGIVKFILKVIWDVLIVIWQDFKLFFEEILDAIKDWLNKD